MVAFEEPTEANGECAGRTHFCATKAKVMLKLEKKILFQEKNVVM